MRALATTRSLTIIGLTTALALLTGCASSNASWTDDYNCTKTWSIGTKGTTWRDMLTSTLPAEQTYGHDFDFQYENALQDWNGKMRQANHYAGPLTGSLTAGTSIIMPVACPAAPTAKP